MSYKVGTGYTKITLDVSALGAKKVLDDIKAIDGYVDQVNKKKISIDASRFNVDKIKDAIKQLPDEAQRQFLEANKTLFKIVQNYQNGLASNSEKAYDQVMNAIPIEDTKDTLDTLIKARKVKSKKTKLKENNFEVFKESYAKMLASEMNGKAPSEWFASFKDPKQKAMVAQSFIEVQDYFLKHNKGMVQKQSVQNRLKYKNNKGEYVDVMSFKDYFYNLRNEANKIIDDNAKLPKKQKLGKNDKRLAHDVAQDIIKKKLGIVGTAEKMFPSGIKDTKSSEARDIQTYKNMLDRIELIEKALPALKKKKEDFLPVLQKAQKEDIKFQEENVSADSIEEIVKEAEEEKEQALKEVSKDRTRKKKQHDNAQKKKLKEEIKEVQEKENKQAEAKKERQEAREKKQKEEEETKKQIEEQKAAEAKATSTETSKKVNKNKYGIPGITDIVLDVTMVGKEELIQELQQLQGYIKTVNNGIYYSNEVDAKKLVDYRATIGKDYSEFKDSKVNKKAFTQASVLQKDDYVLEPENYIKQINGSTTRFFNTYLKDIDNSLEKSESVLQEYQKMNKTEEEIKPYQDAYDKLVKQKQFVLGVLDEFKSKKKAVPEALSQVNFDEIDENTEASQRRVEAIREGISKLPDATVDVSLINDDKVLAQLREIKGYIDTIKGNMVFSVDLNKTDFDKAINSYFNQEGNKGLKKKFLDVNQDFVNIVSQKKDRINAANNDPGRFFISGRDSINGQEQEHLINYIDSLVYKIEEAKKELAGEHSFERIKEKGKQTIQALINNVPDKSFSTFESLNYVRELASEKKKKSIDDGRNVKMRQAINNVYKLIEMGRQIRSKDKAQFDSNYTLNDGTAISYEDLMNYIKQAEELEPIIAKSRAGKAYLGDVNNLKGGVENHVKASFNRIAEYNASAQKEKEYDLSVLEQKYQNALVALEISKSKVKQSAELYKTFPQEVEEVKQVAEEAEQEVKEAQQEVKEAIQEAKQVQEQTSEIKKEVIDSKQDVVPDKKDEPKAVVKENKDIGIDSPIEKPIERLTDLIIDVSMIGEEEVLNRFRSLSGYIKEIDGKMYFNAEDASGFPRSYFDPTTEELRKQWLDGNRKAKRQYNYTQEMYQLINSKAQGRVNSTIRKNYVNDNEIGNLERVNGFKKQTILDHIKKMKSEVSSRQQNYDKINDSEYYEKHLFKSIEEILERINGYNKNRIDESLNKQPGDFSKDKKKRFKELASYNDTISKLFELENELKNIPNTLRDKKNVSFKNKIYSINDILGLATQMRNNNIPSDFIVNELVNSSDEDGNIYNDEQKLNKMKSRILFSKLEKYTSAFTEEDFEGTRLNHEKDLSQASKELENAKKQLSLWEAAYEELKKKQEVVKKYGLQDEKGREEFNRILEEQEAQQQKEAEEQRALEEQQRLEEQKRIQEQRALEEQQKLEEQQRIQKQKELEEKRRLEEAKKIQQQKEEQAKKQISQAKTVDNKKVRYEQPSLFDENNIDIVDNKPKNVVKQVAKQPVVEQPKVQDNQVLPDLNTPKVIRYNIEFSPTIASIKEDIEAIRLLAKNIKLDFDIDESLNIIKTQLTEIKNVSDNLKLDFNSEESLNTIMSRLTEIKKIFDELKVDFNADESLNSITNRIVDIKKMSDNLDMHFDAEESLNLIMTKLMDIKKVADNLRVDFIPNAEISSMEKNLKDLVNKEWKIDLKVSDDSFMDSLKEIKELKIEQLKLEEQARQVKEKNMKNRPPSKKQNKNMNSGLDGDDEDARSYSEQEILEAELRIRQILKDEGIKYDSLRVNNNGNVLFDEIVNDFGKEYTKASYLVDNFEDTFYNSVLDLSKIKEDYATDVNTRARKRVNKDAYKDVLSQIEGRTNNFQVDWDTIKISADGIMDFVAYLKEANGESAKLKMHINDIFGDDSGIVNKRGAFRANYLKQVKKDTAEEDSSKIVRSYTETEISEATAKIKDILKQNGFEYQNASVDKTGKVVFSKIVEDLGKEYTRLTYSLDDFKEIFDGTDIDFDYLTEHAVKALEVKTRSKINKDAYIDKTMQLVNNTDGFNVDLSQIEVDNDGIVTLKGLLEDINGEATELKMTIKDVFNPDPTMITKAGAFNKRYLKDVKKRVIEEKALEKEDQREKEIKGYQLKLEELFSIVDNKIKIGNTEDQVIPIVANKLKEKVDHAKDIFVSLKKDLPDIEYNKIKSNIDEELEKVQNSINDTSILKKNKKGSFLSQMVLGDDNDFREIRKEVRERLTELGHTNIEFGSYNNKTNQLGFKSMFDGKKQSGLLSIEKLKEQIGDYNYVIREVNRNEKDVLTPGEEWMSGLKKKFRNLSQYLTGIEALSRIMNEVRQGFAFVTEIDSLMTTIHQTSDIAKKDFNELTQSAIDQAKALGTNVQQVTGAIEVYTAYGETVDSLLHKTTPTTMLAKATGGDIKTASDQIQGV